MKFANSIKYINSFDRAPDAASVSQKRIRELCESLGRVSLGMKYICLPKSNAGHACAVMLESVIKSAGYTVGRITSVADFDARNSVFINRCKFKMNVLLKLK
jgi:folylpolyglutamate synthase/dihydropteroate synthase